MISAKEISASATCVIETLTVVDLPPLFLEVVRETDSTLSDEMKKTVVALETPVCSPEATAMTVTVDLVPPVPDLTTLARFPTIPNLLEAAAAAACPCEIVLAPVIETSETCATATWTVVVPRCVDPFLPHHSVDLPLLSEVLPVDPLHLHSAGLAPFLLVTGILATENILFLLDVVVTLVLPGQPLRICCVGWAGGSITNWRNPCLLVPNSTEMTGATGTGVALLLDREGLWRRECRPGLLLTVERVAEEGEEEEAAMLAQAVAVTVATKEMVVVTVAMMEMTAVMRMENDVKLQA